MNSNEFYNELKHLTQLGYLDQVQLDRIRDEYIETRRDHRNMFLIFALLGVIFVGAGVISLFAYNWSMFSREMKALISFLPLFGVQGLLYWKIRTRASDVWIKSLTLALGIAFLSALGLIYQAYQISLSLHSMLLTGFLVMLPVVYLLDGYYLAILYMAGICWAGGNSDYTLLVLLLVPYYINRVKQGETCWQLSLCFFFWILYLAFLYLSGGAFYACVLVLFIYMTIEKPGLYPRLAGRLLYTMLFLKAAFYVFFNELTELFAYGEPNRYFPHLPRFLLLALMIAALVRLYLFCRKQPEDGRVGLLLSLILCSLLVTDLILFPETYVFAYEVLVNLCLIAFSLYKLLAGVKAANLPSVRRYTAAIILYILFKVFLGNYQLMVKGIVFLMAGLAFFSVNYMMTLKLKGVNTHETKSE